MKPLEARNLNQEVADERTSSLDRMRAMKQQARALATAWRESPLLVVGLIVTTIASLLPIWIGRYVPLLLSLIHI